MTKDLEIAVLMTCHNRAEKTLRALAHLADQQEPGASLTVYLVDDGCTDATAELVAQRFPDVRILRGDGQLYWGGGMALAFGTALQTGYDFYLWLNDDVALFADAIRRLVAAFVRLERERGKQCIVVGATCDPSHATITSSGVRAARFRRFHYVVVPPGEDDRQCLTFHGNCVLIPRRVAADVGNLDRAFRHYVGDIDYGLRARRKGHESWVAPGFVGTCTIEVPAPITARGPKAFVESLVQLCGPKGVQLPGGLVYSFGEWGRFAMRHGGPLWLVYFIYPYRRLLTCFLSTNHRNP